MSSASRVLAGLDTRTERKILLGRLAVVAGCREQARPGGEEHARWTLALDTLLDRLLEVRGR